MLNQVGLGCYISLAAVAICMCWQNDCGREFCLLSCRAHTEAVVPPLQKLIPDWAVTATLPHAPCTMSWLVRMNTTKSMRQAVGFRSDPTRYKSVLLVKIVITGVPGAVNCGSHCYGCLNKQSGTDTSLAQLFAKGGVPQYQSVAWHTWCLYVLPRVVKTLLAVSIWLTVCLPEVGYEMCGTPGKKYEGNDCLEGRSKVGTFKTGSCQNRVCILELCLKLLALGQWRV